MAITIKEGCTGNKKEGLFEKEVKLNSGASVIIRFGFIWNGEELERVFSGTVKREKPDSFPREVSEIAQFKSNMWYFIETGSENEVKRLVSDAFEEVKEFFVNEE